MARVSDVDGTGEKRSDFRRELDVEVAKFSIVSNVYRFFSSIHGMIGCDDGHILGGLKTTNQISIYLHISQRCLMILWPFLVATSVCSGNQWERGIYAPFFCSHVTWIRCVKVQRWAYGSTLKRMGPPIEHGWCEVEGYRCLWYFIGLDGSRIIKLSGSPAP